MKNKKVLFFGRYKERKSQQLLIFLKKRFSKVISVWSKKYGQKIPSKIKKIKGDYIFCYRSYFILDPKLIKNFKLSINFHPGNHLYRGIGCLNFALLNKAKKYGVTAHLINKKIDSGKIIKVNQFKISNKINVAKLLKLTNEKNFKLAKEIINLTYKDDKKIFQLIDKNRRKWTKKIYFRKDLKKLYNIKIKINKDKINNIYRATAFKNYKPYLIIGKSKILLKKFL